MSSLIQRWLSTTGEKGETPREPLFLSPRVLVLSADLRFYAAVLSAINSRVWDADWVRSIEAAVEACEHTSVSIVLYDENLPRVEWRKAFERLRKLRNRPRILLAANGVDERLWRAVLHHHGYDLVARTADSAQLKRALRFAWLSLQDAAF